MDTVAVLMSTYNGEKYIEEQIRSILRQTGVDIFLIIRDDGSSDRTKEILETNYSKYNNVKIIYGENVGVGNSFMDMLYDAPDAEFYAFADQDDIWLENKLCKAIEKVNAEIEDENTPCLYGSNQMLIDGNGKQIGLKNKSNRDINIDTVNLIIRNCYAGCTMVFNRALKKMMSLDNVRPDKKYFETKLHDEWCVSFAQLVGKVIYDENSYMLYRQHENNVVGVKNAGKIKIIRRILQVCFGKRPVALAVHASQLLESTKLLNIDENDEKIIYLFSKSNTLCGKLNIITDKDLIKKIKVNNGCIRLKVMLGCLE